MIKQPEKTLTYEEWRLLGPELAAEYTSKRMGLDDERKRKLLLILKTDWNGTHIQQS